MWQMIALISFAFPQMPIPELKTDLNEQDVRVHALLREVINHGADLYNRGDANGCYRLYEGALLALRAHAQMHPDWQAEISCAFERAAGKPQVAQRAFVLREAMDRIRCETDPVR